MQFLKIRVNFLKVTSSPGLFPKKMGGRPAPPKPLGTRLIVLNADTLILKLNEENLV